MAGSKKTRARVQELIDKAKDSKAHDVERALRAWKRLSRDQQRRLVHEIVEIRGEELRAAYPSMVGIGWGHRMVGRGADRKSTSEPCVVFLVNRKWASGKEPKSKAALAKRLPEYLLSYFETDPKSGRRELIAVPTGVESRTDYKIKPHVASPSVRVTHDGVKAQHGVITSALAVEGSEKLYAMGCHHVLAMSKATKGKAVNGAEFSYEGDRLGRLSFPAPFGPDLARSLDSAVARVTKEDRFWDAVPPLDLIGSITDLSQLRLGMKVKIIRPRHHPVRNDNRTLSELRAKLLHAWKPCDLIGYVPRALGTITQELVIESEITSSESPQPGDSGSPVIDPVNRLFVGMHIAGDGGTRAFLIPAPVLLDSKNYPGLEDYGLRAFWKREV